MLPEAEPRSVGERRQLTLLFCDLVGSTELAARLDAEEWHEIGGAYQRAASQAVTRYGGHVAKYLGDGLVVYFGYPQAHEDDAERAVRGGLAIVEAVASLNGQLQGRSALALSVRVGLHTGAVVVGAGGGEELEVFGEAPNLAARLQGVAAPDTVVISSATLRLVRGVFDTEDLGPQTLKGIPQPVQAFRVIQPSSVSSRWEVRGARLGPLLGRGQDIAVLRRAGEASSAGAGGAVIISGEAGVGKSRLVHGLRESLRGEQQSWLWLESRCAPFTQQSAFQPAIELLEQALGFAPADTAADRLAKLRAGLDAVALGTEETVAPLAALLSIPLPDEHPIALLPRGLRRERTLEAMVRWIVALSRLQPVVVVVEDLHWCDPSSLELLERLIAQSSRDRVLVLLTVRAEAGLDWAPPSAETISLRRLESADAHALIMGLAGDTAFPAEVAEAIVARADGVPLWIEELTKSVLESSVADETRAGSRRDADQPTVPMTLQDSLMARLDRLNTAKQVAQVAAALGREFSYALLEAVATHPPAELRGGLARLMEAELLFRSDASAEEAYVFKHALIQETAYQSMLKNTRRDLHRRIATALEARFPDRAVREPEVVGRHWEAAAEPNGAVRHYELAAGQAVIRSAHEEAIAHLRRALELLETLPPTPDRSQRELTLQLALGNSLMSARSLSSDEARLAYERANALCDHAADDWQRAPSAWGLSVIHTAAGQLQRGIEFAERLLEIAERTGEDIHFLSAHEEFAVPKYYRGEFASSLRHAEAGVQIYDTRYDHARSEALAWIYPTEPGVPVRIYCAMNLWQLGFPDQAAVRAREAVELARRRGHPFSLGFAIAFGACVQWMRGDFEAQAEAADEVVRIAERHRFPLWLGLGNMLSAVPLLKRGQTAEGTTRMLTGMDVATRLGGQAGAPVFQAMLAEVFRANGRIDRAVETLEMATALAAHLGQHFWDAELHRLRGEYRLSGADPSSLAMQTAEEAAEEHFRSAVAIAAGQGAKSQELRAATSLARLLRRRGKREAALAALSPVYSWFGEGFSTADLAEARSLLDDLRASD